LAGLGATGALFVGWSLRAPRQRLHPSLLPDVGPGSVPLNGWLAIHPNGRVTVVSPKAEMGQGIHTALAMLVAEELDCDWDQVEVVYSGIDKIYNNAAAIVHGLPFHEDLENHPGVRGVRWFTAKAMREVGVMLTGGSSSVRDVWEVAREAGATARAALVAAAAARANVEVSTCRTERGVVIAGGREYRYGDLVRDAALQRVSNVALKSPDRFTIIGKDRPRLDTDAIITGVPRFSMDVSLDGMLYAAVLMPPTLGSTVTTFDRKAALQKPGVRAVVELTGSRFGDPPGLAVVADKWWQAKQALPALNAQWSVSPHASLSTNGIMQTLRTAAAGNDGLPFRSDGDAEEVLATSARTLESTYESPYLAHAAMEPLNATAVAMAVDLPDDLITVHQTPLGGGFGRRLEADYVAQAAAIAKALPGVPVQTIWSREDDMRHDFYRPAGVSRMRAGLNAAGQVTSVVVHSAGQAPFRALGARLGLSLVTDGPDKSTAEGTFDQPYEFPAMRVSNADVELPVPVGSWRSVGHSFKGFAMECFVDELAHEAGVDPLRYRQLLLQKHPRARAVLNLVAAQSSWNTPLDPLPNGRKRARGVALHWSFGSVVGMVAEVSLGDAGAFAVERVVCAVDAGIVVNPLGARQQIESAVVYGLSAALYGEVLVDNGRIRPGNFHEYRPLRFSECPVIETHFVPSSRAPSGMGEPGVPVVAPAVANALFALTGKRLRTLPLRAEALV
jgi:isoquinoline 1-oxidoreductase subunit beta